MTVNLFCQNSCYLILIFFLQIRSRAKIEKIRASLFNSSDLIGLSSLDGEDELMEMSTEEILTVSTVNQSLFDTQGSPALEDYFNDKSIKGMCFSYRQISHTQIYRGQTMWLLIIITVLGKRGEGIRFSIINGVLKYREVRSASRIFL